MIPDSLSLDISGFHVGHVGAVVGQDDQGSRSGWNSTLQCNQLIVVILVVATSL